MSHEHVLAQFKEYDSVDDHKRTMLGAYAALILCIENKNKLPLETILDVIKTSMDLIAESATTLTLSVSLQTLESTKDSLRMQDLAGAVLHRLEKRDKVRVQLRNLVELFKPQGAADA